MARIARSAVSGVANEIDLTVDCIYSYIQNHPILVGSGTRLDFGEKDDILPTTPSSSEGGTCGKSIGEMGYVGSDHSGELYCPNSSQNQTPTYNLQELGEHIQGILHRLTLLEAVVASKILVPGPTGEVIDGASIHRNGSEESGVKNLKFSDFAKTWLRTKTNLTKKGQSDREREIRMFCDAIGSLDISSITSADIATQLYPTIADGRRAPATVRSMGTHIHEIFSFAIENRLRADNPVTARSWPSIQHGASVRTMVELTFEDEEKLCRKLEVYHSSIAMIVRFVVRVPLRLRALRGLLWSMIDAHGVLRVPKSLMKTHIDWIFPLSRATLEYLGTRGDPGNPIFRNLPSDSHIYRLIKDTADQMGVHGLNPTNLRRTFLCRLRRVATPFVIDKMAQWSSETMRKHYNMPIPEIESRRYQEEAEHAARCGA